MTPTIPTNRTPEQLAIDREPTRRLSIGGEKKKRWRFHENGVKREDIACLAWTRDEAVAWYKQTHGVDLPDGMTVEGVVV
ncbi:MAG TPA: hypothetical protein VG125_04545 [Pirellulales bacterium]|jgi:hypothetical protein|nr:hypothetical protein [Pirellulales bacterium]